MLEKVRSDLMICGRCGKCIVSDVGFVCPVHQHSGGFDESAARGRNSIAKAVMQGRLELDQDVVDNTYTCLGCKRCGVACRKEDGKGGRAIDECKITIAMREEIVKAGKEPEVLAAVDRTIDDTYNPFGMDPAKRTKWADGLDLPDAGETVYFAGCYAALRNTKIAKATAQILKAGGIDIAYLGEDEWCCGVPAINDGNSQIAEKLIAHNIEALQKAGCKTVITSCAGCYHALKSDYKEIVGELPFEVKHSSEVIAELIKEGKLEPKEAVAAKATYHDPCHLGRHEGVYDAPREIIAAIPGVEFSEMPMNKDAAWCCGGGSIVSNIYPDLTEAISADRVDEAKKTGAEVILSACPSCEANLLNAGRKKGVKTEDINVILAKSLGIRI